MEQTLTEEKIAELVTEVKAMIAPFYNAIEQARKANADREVGGRIKSGKLQFMDESQWLSSSVVGEFHEEERKITKDGWLTFHTHPVAGLPHESAADILAAYYRLREVIIHEQGITLLIALKELPVDIITKLDEQAWKEAQLEEEKSGEQAYWFWKGILQQKLPVRVVNFKL
ncbi:MAG: hypothetical protein V1707_00680 [bacterium]